MWEGRKHRSEEGCLCVSLLCVGHERVCVQLQQKDCMRSNAAPAKMHAVSPVRWALKRKSHWRNVPRWLQPSLLNAASAERRGLDRFYKMMIRIQFTDIAQIIF